MISTSDGPDSYERCSYCTVLRDKGRDYFRYRDRAYCYKIRPTSTVPGSEVSMNRWPVSKPHLPYIVKPTLSSTFVSSLVRVVACSPQTNALLDEAACVQVRYVSLASASFVLRVPHSTTPTMQTSTLSTSFASCASITRIHDHMT